MAVAGVTIAGLFAEWEREETARRDQSERMKAIFAVGKSNHLNPKALRAAFRIRYAELHQTAEERTKAEANDTVISEYLEVLAGLPGRAREIIEEFDAATGEIRDPSDKVAKAERTSARRAKAAKAEPAASINTEPATHAADGAAPDVPQADGAALNAGDAEPDHPPQVEASPAADSQAKASTGNAVEAEKGDLAIASSRRADGSGEASRLSVGGGTDASILGEGLEPAEAHNLGSDGSIPSPATSSAERPTVAAEVTTPEANTRGQTGSAGERARSLSPANAEAVAKKVEQSGQIAAVEPTVDTHQEPPSSHRSDPQGSAAATREGADTGAPEPFRTDAQRALEKVQAERAARRPGETWTETCPPIAVTRHELSRVFPEHFGMTLAELKDNIRENGVQRPIIKIDNAILDGWARYTCARELGIAYPVKEYDGSDPLADLIRWQCESRGKTLPRQSLASKLMKLVPDRAADIAELFGVEFAPAEKTRRVA